MNNQRPWEWAKHSLPEVLSLIAVPYGSHILSRDRKGWCFSRALTASLSRVSWKANPSRMFCPLGWRFPPKLRNGGWLLIPPQGGSGPSQAGGRAAALEADSQHLVGRGGPHEAGLANGTAYAAAGRLGFFPCYERVRGL